MAVDADRLAFSECSALRIASINTTVVDIRQDNQVIPQNLSRFGIRNADVDRVHVRFLVGRRHDDAVDGQPALLLALHLPLGLLGLPVLGTVEVILHLFVRLSI